MFGATGAEVVQAAEKPGPTQQTQEVSGSKVAINLQHKVHTLLNVNLFVL